MNALLPCLRPVRFLAVIAPRTEYAMLASHVMCEELDRPPPRPPVCLEDMPRHVSFSDGQVARTISLGEERQVCTVH